MKIAEAQRAELDAAKRQQPAYQAQEAIDQGAALHLSRIPQERASLRQVDLGRRRPSSKQSGIGIRSFWTFLRAEPLTDQTDMICNASEALIAMNPLYISGAIDSWGSRKSSGTA